MRSEVVYGAGRHGHRHPPRLDLRRHVLGLRDPGHRQQEARRVHPRGARAARQDQCRVAQGLRLFHLAKVNGKKVDFIDPPTGYYLDYKDQILTLHFTLPLKTPVEGAGPRGRDLRSVLFRRLLVREGQCGRAGRRAGRLQAGGRASGGDGCRDGGEAVPDGARPEARSVGICSARSSPTESWSNVPELQAHRGAHGTASF